MAYDAEGQRNEELPFMTSLRGRTDMLGRRHVGDIKIMQLIGTVLMQAHAGEGPFKNLAIEFKQRFAAILEKHKTPQNPNGIAHILDEEWIFLEGESKWDDSANQRHYETVKTCTDAYLKCAEDFQTNGNQEGIIFEARALLDWLESEVKQIQAAQRTPTCK